MIIRNIMTREQSDSLISVTDPLNLLSFVINNNYWMRFL